MNESQTINTPKYLTSSSNYDKHPFVRVTDSSDDCKNGWSEIGDAIKTFIDSKAGKPTVIVVDNYPGVLDEEVSIQLQKIFQPDLTINTKDLFHPEKTLNGILEPYMGDHPIFGKLSNLRINDFFDPDKIATAENLINQHSDDIVLIYGIGSSTLASEPDVLIYADMARWEIQQRMRRHEVHSLGFNNRTESAGKLYKQAFFIDWRVADHHKMDILNRVDFILDTNDRTDPKLISAGLLHKGLAVAASQPFRVVPFFDPGVWGGQWMKEVCDLDQEKINYAWCFDCVPEENSLLLGFGEHRFEIPAINLVLAHPQRLLGNKIFESFGAEFPIRFDFLDTMEGGNLSLQVHPLKQYMKEHFGLEYTQDESYYMLDVEADAVVYLGLKTQVDRKEMIADLRLAEKGEIEFDAEKYVNKFPVKKHDHILIPAGTVHCSGKNGMVLEISATPYIFTFKLWDWGRVDLDGKTRTISIDHGIPNIQWDWDTNWTKAELINQFKKVDEGDGWYEEKTGWHPLEFIETRRHWFSKKVTHDTAGNLQVVNLIEGREVIIESPSAAFKPFVVHYAETFIVPAAVGLYTITPYGESIGQQCATIKAFVR
ncbi:MAG: class I mannose-6-phosphate isomerase [Saprospiraceae bacterium]|nr:class I mannose-6-phosphate isomerase [Saprospiraceae bacterium]